MNTYYEVTANIDGFKEVLFGSFDKSDCKYEIEAEKDSWKSEGYKSIKIEARETEEKPDPEVYENLVSSEIIEAFVEFNNEGDLSEYIEEGLITRNNDQFFVNDESILKIIIEHTTNVKAFKIDYLPCFNFELDGNELIELGLKFKFIKFVNSEKTMILINHKYEGMNNA